jgi:hypothetical protein
VHSCFKHFHSGLNLTGLNHFSLCSQDTLLKQQIASVLPVIFSFSLFPEIIGIYNSFINFCPAPWSLWLLSHTVQRSLEILTNILSVFYSRNVI